MTETKRMWLLPPFSCWPRPVKARRSIWGRPGSVFWLVDTERMRDDSFEEGVSIFHSEADARRYLVSFYREQIKKLEKRIVEEETWLREHGDD